MSHLDTIKSLAKNIRIDILEMTSNANSGHPGGSLSATDIVAVLYGSILNYDSSNPKWESRDRFILSKAHACPVLYAALAETGYFDKSELMTFRKLNSRLQGHAHIKTPGVEMSGGSLGQGLSFGVGVSLAAKVDQKNYRTFVLLGDGELNEGQVWEAIMSANKYKLDNLVAIVDKNGIQNDRFTHQVMDMSPIIDKWDAFGWETYTVNGHDITDIYKIFNSLDFANKKPKVIIADTIKGKGVSFMENNPDFHGKTANEEQLREAIKEINSN
tara:strand:- start:4879 stop:5694 length:816 start_codon:yes stop_codon:yes gene_type:complete